MIRILHVYPNLLNIFGGAGDMNVLKKYLDECGAEYEMDAVEVDDDIDFSGYDFVYFGAGTEDRTLVALNDIMKHSDDLHRYINSGGCCLMIGSSEMLAVENITDADGKVHNALGIINGIATIYQRKNYSDLFGICPVSQTPVLAASNSSTEYSDVTADPFLVLSYDSNTNFKGKEGFVYKNCYGTEAFGPLFARNPQFLKDFCRKHFNVSLNGADPQWIEEAYKGYDFAVHMIGMDK